MIKLKLKQPTSERKLGWCWGATLSQAQERPKAPSLKGWTLARTLGFSHQNKLTSKLN